VLLVLLILVSILLTSCRASVDGGGDRQAHDFVLPTLDHGRFYLNQSHGKVVVLCFWATICRHCHQQLRALGSLMERYSAHSVHLAAVCTDPENDTAIRRFVEAVNIPYPILLDAGGRVFKRFGGHGLPTTVILDQAGIQRLIRLGYSEAIQKQIEAQIDLLLDGTPAS
jgi:peroxiredoxin Q/BCP